MLRIALHIVMLLIAPASLLAADFYLYFDKCKLAVSYFVHSNESLKILEGDGSLTSCTRISQTVQCDIDFLGGSKGSRITDTYKIYIESPPTLIFTNERMSDYYVIDMTQHVATLITRVMEPSFPEQKSVTVCT
jgi:hypothetical protein